MTLKEALEKDADHIYRHSLMDISDAGLECRDALASIGAKFIIPKRVYPVRKRTEELMRLRLTPAPSSIAAPGFLWWKARMDHERHKQPRTHHTLDGKTTECDRKIPLGRMGWEINEGRSSFGLCMYCEMRMAARQGKK